MPKITKSLFFPAKDKALARKIKIDTPSAFKKSISTLKKHGLTTKEFRALKLAQTRARVQLRRKNLSNKEVRQMAMIVSTKIPRPTK